MDIQIYNTGLKTWQEIRKNQIHYHIKGMKSKRLDEATKRLHIVKEEQKIKD